MEDTARIPLRRLWIGLLLAPATWVLGELIGYYIAARSCEPRAGGIPLLGASSPAVVEIVIQIVAALVAVAGIGIAFTSWRRSRPTGGVAHAYRERSEFMAFAGMILGAVLLFGILLFVFPGFVVRACDQAR